MVNAEYVVVKEAPDTQLIWLKITSLYLGSRNQAISLFNALIACDLRREEADGSPDKIIFSTLPILWKLWAGLILNVCWLFSRIMELLIGCEVDKCRNFSLSPLRWLLRSDEAAVTEIVKSWEHDCVAVWRVLYQILANIVLTTSNISMAGELFANTTFLLIHILSIPFHFTLVLIKTLSRCGGEGDEEWRKCSITDDGNLRQTVTYEKYEP